MFSQFIVVEGRLRGSAEHDRTTHFFDQMFQHRTGWRHKPRRQGLAFVQYYDAAARCCAVSDNATACWRKGFQKTGRSS